MKGIATRNTHVQYESPITSGLKVMAKVKVFVNTSHTNPDADSRAMTLAPQTYLSGLAKYSSLHAIQNTYIPLLSVRVSFKLILDSVCVDNDFHHKQDNQHCDCDLYPCSHVE